MTQFDKLMLGKQVSLYFDYEVIARGFAKHERLKYN